MKFSEYYEVKLNQAFGEQFELFCQDVASKNEEFELIWKRDIVPVLENTTAENETELLNEFWGNLFGGGQKKPNPAGNPTFTPDTNPQMHSWLLKNDPHYARAHNNQQRLGQFQQQADSMTDDIKKRFSNAMRMFLKSVHDDSLREQNPHLYKIANSFYNKIMASAQPTIDQFKMQAKIGKPDHSEFNDKLNRMQSSQRQAYANRLQTPQNRANLAAKQTGVPADQLMAQRNAGNPSPFDKDWNAG